MHINLYGLLPLLLLLLLRPAAGDAGCDEDLVAAFHRDGFVIVKSLLAEDEVALVRDALETSEALSTAANTILLSDAAGGATRLNLWSNPGNGTLGLLTRSTRVVGTMRALLGGDVLHYHSKVLLKRPHEGGAWNWHQDYGYWYKDNFLLPAMATAYFAIDAQDAENGALTVLNGSHAVGRVDHWTKGDQQGADLERVALLTARYAERTLELSPGDAVFFHALLMHTSKGNLSPRWPTRMEHGEMLAATPCYRGLTRCRRSLRCVGAEAAACAATFASGRRRMALASAFTRRDNTQFRNAYIPCYEVEEVPDTALRARGLAIESAESMVLLESARGKEAAAKRDGSGYE